MSAWLLALVLALAACSTASPADPAPKDASAEPAGLKGDPAPVGGEGRIDVVRGVSCQPDRKAIRNRLDPDVESLTAE